MKDRETGLLSELDKQDIVGVHLITAAEAFLPEFYEQFGFQKEKRVILMGKEMEYGNIRIWKSTI